MSLLVGAHVVEFTGVSRFAHFALLVPPATWRPIIVVVVVVVVVVDHPFLVAVDCGSGGGRRWLAEEAPLCAFCASIL